MNLTLYLPEKPQKSNISDVFFQIAPDGYKKCLVCKEIKTEDNFSKKISTCKNCTSVRNREDYKRNKEYYLKRSKKYVEQNKEKVAKYKKRVSH